MALLPGGLTKNVGIQEPTHSEESVVRVSMFRVHHVALAQIRKQSCAKRGLAACRYNDFAPPARSLE